MSCIVPRYTERFNFKMLCDNSPILSMEAKNRTKPIGNIELATCQGAGVNQPK